MYFLSIDQGGSSSRALVCDSKGTIITRHQTQVSTQRDGAFIEQNPDELLQSIQTCIDSCLSQLTSAQQNQLRSACLVTQRSSFIAIDSKTQQNLTQVISWQDSRGQAALNALDIDSDWLHNITGLRASAHYGASKMAWCLQHNAQVQKAAANNTLMFLPIAAYLCARLTGNHSYYVDPANAARTLLLDIEHLQWHPKLLSLFGIKKSWLPQIHSTLSDYGTIQLPMKNMPLKYLSGDQSAALFAYGLPSNNEVNVNVGTGAFISRLMTSNENVSEGLLRSILHIDKLRQYFALEGTVNGAGAALDVMSAQLGVAKKDLNLPKASELDKSDCSIPLFINSIGGLAAPFWRSDIHSYFVGDGSPVAKMRAVLESVGFLITTIIDRMNTASSPINAIKISGGLANNDALCQMIADLSSIRLVRLDEIEASALGGVWWLARQSAEEDGLKDDGLKEKNRWLGNIHRKVFLPELNTALSQRLCQWQAEISAITQT